MNISGYDLNRVKALHYLLEEAHVGRAAAQLGITAAAASNALRRLREDLGDPLLVKRGRGLVRTRVGDELRAPARDVVTSAQALLRAALPFSANNFDGDLPIALAEHVATMLLPSLDRMVRERAPHATLMIAAIPLDISSWLKESGGVLVGPAGPLAATNAGDKLLSDDFYAERYVCVMRRGHPLSSLRLSARRYADQEHILVLPRGLTARSDVDTFLASKGLTRLIARTVPSFNLAIPLLMQSDLITAMPERNARLLARDEVIFKDMPEKSPPLPMKIISHPAHREDGRTKFIKTLLRDSLIAFDNDWPK